MKSSFDKNAGNGDAILYHGTSHAIDNGRIKPFFSTTHAGARRGKFIFATDTPLLSIAHAIKTKDCIKTGYVGNEVYMLIGDIESYLGEGRKKLDRQLETSRVYELPLNMFEKVQDHLYPYTEWVCKKSISTKNATYHPILSIKHAMEQGIQIFYLKADELKPNEFFISKGIMSHSSAASLLVNTDTIGWVNREENINPSLRLLDEIEKIKLNNDPQATAQIPIDFNDSKPN